jgi:hypothetical protein
MESRLLQLADSRHASVAEIADGTEQIKNTR